MTVKVLLGKLAVFIINPLIVLGFVVATIFLFYSIVELIRGAGETADLDKRRKSVIYGVIGMFVMFSVVGILNIVTKSFGIPCEHVFFC